MFSNNITKNKAELSTLGRVYSNNGNIPLINLLGDGSYCILDIGCGAGDNAALINSSFKNCDVFGVTYSVFEAEIAKKQMKQCWVFDVETDIPADLATKSFDVLIFSHVLEHLRDPAGVLAKFSKLLKNGGMVLIAVPNILSWRMRIKFLCGSFEYQSEGELDDTHLRFFTYFTADRYLLSKCPELKITRKEASGSVPLWWLRRYIIPQRWSEYIDKWGCFYWPNLFGAQVLIKALKQ